jgi:hypothetical protein
LRFSDQTPQSYERDGRNRRSSPSCGQADEEAAVYRQRIRQQILYGQFREYLEIAEEVVAVRRKLGLAEATLWAPTFGTANEVVWEFEYADLAAFERENDAFYGDADAMQLWRRLWQHAVQGSIQDELLQEAPHIA